MLAPNEHLGEPLGGPDVWPGRFFGGLAATATAATAYFEADALVVRVAPDAPLRVWVLSKIQVVQGHFPEQQVLLRHQEGPEEWLVIEQPGFLDALARRPGASPGRRVYGRRRLVSVGIGALLGIALFTSAFYYGALPVAVELATPHVPVAWEERLGALMLPTVASSRHRLPDSAATRAIEHMLTRLPTGAYKYKVVLRNNNAANAFALPGGTIVVNRGLFLLVATPEELMGVLAHEMAHVQLRHTTRAVLHGLGLQFLVTTLTGDTTMGTLAWTLGTLKYSREAESEADREGMRLLQAAQVDPQGMVRVFGRFAREAEKDHEIPTLLSTHPTSREREHTLKLLAAQATYKPRAIDTTIPWAMIQLKIFGGEVEKPADARE